MRRIAVIAVALLALAACASVNTSRMGADLARSHCIDEAGATPRGVEDCLGIGRAAPNIP